MRKSYTFLFIILFFQINHIIAQDYKLDYNVKFEVDQGNGARRYYMQMYYITANNASQQEVSDFNFYQQRGTRVVSGSLTVPASDGPITKLWIETSRQVRVLGTWNSDCGDGQTVALYQGSSGNNCFDLSEAQDWGCINFRSTISNNGFKFYPQISNALVQPMETAFPTDDAVTIGSNFDDFPASVYNWEFSVNNGASWKPFPQQYLGLSALSLNATQLFNGSGLNVNDFIGKNIAVRFKGCDDDNVSNTIIYNIRKSPPHITQVQTTPSACFDSDNGTIKLVFDRALLSQELLQFNLLNASDGSFITSVETATLQPGNSFVWPYPLSPGRYIIKYNARTFTQSGEESWSNIITTDPITVTAPTAVAFTAQKTDVWCYNGSDGTIILQATGGVGNHQYMVKRQGEPDFPWYPFSSASTHTITGLSKGIWEVQVKDGNDCYAKTQAYGSIISQPITINQPEAPLQINEVQRVNPRAFGYADGYFIADIVGGTSRADGSYNYEFKKENGTVITSGITTSATGSGYRIKVDGLADGNYVLNTNDANYASATTAQGCSASINIVMTEPQPIVVEIEITDSILCKKDANGSLVAHVTGGIPFALPALPYQYTWKKKDANGVYEPMPGYTDSIAANLAAGWYAVNVTDANGISLTEDSTFFLPEPEELMVSVTATDVTCSGLANGQVLSSVTGGTTPYKYYWNTGDETAALSNVPAATYMVWVEDYHGCQAQKNTVVNQPNNMRLQIEKKDATCYNGSDGFINLTVEGGTAPFTYNWLGTTSPTGNASNLKSGTYSVIITDVNGCSLSQTETLANPDPLHINLGPDRFVCNGQEINYDITMNSTGSYFYNWSSDIGFTSANPVVALSKAGTYYATVTDINGCNSSDTLLLTAANTQVSNDFALPTHGYAGEKIIFANLTTPKADSVQWLLPANATIVSKTDQLVEMILPDTGSYNVSLRTFKGMCYADKVKKIIINQPANLPSPGNTRNPFILHFSAAPVPNNGSFTVRITLQSASQMELKLINLHTSQVTTISKQSGADKYSIPVNQSLAAGTYVLLLETPKGRETIKILIL